MKLSTVRRKGFTFVRGGRILATTTTIFVPNDGAPQGNHEILDPADYGILVEGSTPYSPRPIESDGVTARQGDMAIEVIDVDLDRVIGHYFVSGPSTAIIRYSQDLLGTINKRTPIGGLGDFFTLARAVAVDLDPVHMPNVEAKLIRGDGEAMGHMASCMVELTGRYQLGYFGNLHVPNWETVGSCVRALHKVFTLFVDGIPKIGHLIGSVHCSPVPKRHLIQGHQPIAYVHMQPPDDVSPYCASPFAHELLVSSKDIESVNFWDLDSERGSFTMRNALAQQAAEDLS